MKKGIKMDAQMGIARSVGVRAQSLRSALECGDETIVTLKTIETQAKHILNTLQGEQLVGETADISPTPNGVVGEINDKFLAINARLIRLQSGLSEIIELIDG